MSSLDFGQAAWSLSQPGGCGANFPGMWLCQCVLPSTRSAPWKCQPGAWGRLTLLKGGFVEDCLPQARWPPAHSARKSEPRARGATSPSLPVGVIQPVQEALPETGIQPVPDTGATQESAVVLLAP